MNDPKYNVIRVLMKKKDSMIETWGKDVMGPEKQRWSRGFQTDAQQDYQAHQRLETLKVPRGANSLLAG